MRCHSFAGRARPAPACPGTVRTSGAEGVSATDMRVCANRHAHLAQRGPSILDLPDEQSLFRDPEEDINSQRVAYWCRLAQRSNTHFACTSSILFCMTYLSIAPYRIAYSLCQLSVRSRTCHRPGIHQLAILCHLLRWCWGDEHEVSLRQARVRRYV